MLFLRYARNHGFGQFLRFCAAIAEHFRKISCIIFAADFMPEVLLYFAGYLCIMSPLIGAKQADERM